MKLHGPAHSTDHGIRNGDHICCFYRNNEEQKHVLTKFIRDGLNSGDKVQYLSKGPEDTARLVSWLREANVDVDAALAIGQLGMEDAMSVYLHLNTFDGDKMVERVKAMTSQALSEGYKCLSLAGELNWACSEGSVLINYEASLNRMFTSDGAQPAPLKGLCMYDMRVFSSPDLLSVLSVHPYVAGIPRSSKQDPRLHSIFDTRAHDHPKKDELCLFDNFYYLPPDEIFGVGLLTATVDRYLQQLEYRHNLEYHLIEAMQHARASESAKSHFLANMSHELRTPMNGVLMGSELLIQSGLSKEQRDIAKTIYRCAFHLQNLIDDVLDLSQLESGKIQLEPREFSVVECVQDAIEFSYGTTNQKALVPLFVPNPPDDCLPPENSRWDSVASTTSAKSDRARIAQVLVKLVDNALKFSDKGRIVVRAWAETKECLESGPAASADDGADSRLWFSVEDKGIGIPDGFKDTIFDRFTQVDTTMTRKHEGSGLGLAICKHLVELMGGSISVRSEIGEGSTFSFYVKAPGIKGANVAGPRYVIQEIDSEACRIRWTKNHPKPAAPLMLASGAPSPSRAMLSLSGSEMASWVPADVSTSTSPKPQLSPASGRTIPIPPPRVAMDVLVVEDNIVNQKVISRVLSTMGYACDLVKNGEEAVEATRRKTYDLILMDIHMPVLDGHDAAVKIRQEACPKRGPVIIALTASTREMSHRKCVDAGMDGFVSKPLTSAKVHAMIQHAIQLRHCYDKCSLVL